MNTKPLLPILILMNCSWAFAESSQSLQAYFGASSFKYNLSSEQFSVDQPMNNGQAVRINYSRQNFNSNTEHRLGWFKTENEISVPASLSPSVVNYRQSKLQYRYIINSELLGYGAGYSFQKVDAGTTTPNMLIGSYEAHSVAAFIERTVWHKSDFSFQLFASLELPVIRKELGTNTGFNQSSFTTDIGYAAKFLLNESWSIVQTSEYSLTTTSFDGQGNRGTLNAKEKHQYINILLGAGYDF